MAVLIKTLIRVGDGLLVRRAVRYEGATEGSKGWGADAGARRRRRAEWRAEVAARSGRVGHGTQAEEAQSAGEDDAPRGAAARQRR